MNAKVAVGKRRQRGEEPPRGLARPVAKAVGSGVPRGDGKPFGKHCFASMIMAVFHHEHE